MPLNKSGSEESVGENIATERAAGKPEKQAIAIAESVKRANDDGSCPFGAKAPGAATQDDESVGMFGAKSPGASTLDFGYGDTEHPGFTQVGSHDDIKRAAEQMWGSNVHDPENKNGIVTP